MNRVRPVIFRVNKDGESGDGQSPDNMLPLQFLQRGRSTYVQKI